VSFDRKVARRARERGPAVLRQLPILLHDLQKKLAGLEQRAAARKLSAADRDAAVFQAKHVRGILEEPSLLPGARQAWAAILARLERLEAAHARTGAASTAPMRPRADGRPPR
jgi:hypothetical protein